MTRAERGILVLGAPRSGTTLVGRVLDAHPRIHCPPETNLFNACATFLEEHRFGDGLAVGVVPGLAFSGVPESRVLDALRGMVFDLMGEVAARAGKPRWAEKTAVAVFHLDGIERLVATHCQFVCIVRHGLDVACSARELADKMGIYLPELHQYIQRYLSPTEALTHAWLDATSRLLQFADAYPDAAFLIRYEDLIERPADAIARVFKFLDEDPSTVDMGCVFERPSTVGLGDWKTFERHGFSTASIGRWKEQLGRQASGLAHIVNPLLERLGYEPVPEGAPPDSEAARRRLELELMLARLRRPDGA